MANARAKAEQADQSAIKAEQDSDHARIKAKEYAPEFHQPGIEGFEQYDWLYKCHDVDKCFKVKALLWRKRICLL